MLLDLKHPSPPGATLGDEAIVFAKGIEPRHDLAPLAIAPQNRRQTGFTMIGKFHFSGPACLYPRKSAVRTFVCAGYLPDSANLSSVTPGSPEKLGSGSNGAELEPSAKRVRAVRNRP
jgi:hypothetical protein